MKFRLLVLVLGLSFRCILGWFYTLNFTLGEKVKVTGYIYNIYHRDSKCVIKIANFLFTNEKICALKVNQKISVIGTLDREVIDSFNGNLWLRDAEIDLPSEIDNVKISRNSKTELLDYFRSNLVARFKNYVPEPEASLVSGVVLGYKNDIGQDFYDQMIKSGTVHIAVASGYNILLVGGSAMAIAFYLFKRKWATMIAIASMMFYALLAGGEPPVTRALWMAGMLFIGKVIGRGSQTAWILVLTVWVMLMVDPVLVSSVSFQLSVMASVGLMMLEPHLSRYLQKIGGTSLSGFLSGVGVTTTLSTMITTMPVLWWHFDRVSFIGILSNTLILPLVPALMILGAMMLVVPWFMAWPVYAVAHWIVLMIKFFGS